MQQEHATIAGERFSLTSRQSKKPGPHRGREADALRPFKGKWIAQRGPEVLVTAETPQEIVGWLEQHDQRADVMFRVPVDETDASGVAPG